MEIAVIFKRKKSSFKSVLARNLESKMHTENSPEIPLQVGKFNHGREFRFVVVNVNIEIEAAGRKRENALWKRRLLKSNLQGCVYGKLNTVSNGRRSA